MASPTGTPSPSSTRQASCMRSPLTPSEARSPIDQCAVRPRWKNGPAVCDGMGTRLISLLERRGVASTQNDVELVAQRPFRFGCRQVKVGDQALPRLFVAYGLEDGIVSKQRI